MAKILDANDLLKLNRSGIFKRITDGGFASTVGYSNTMPGGILTQISPKHVEVILRKRTADRVAGGRTKALDWAENEVVIPIVEKTGEASAYGDRATVANADTNINFVERGHYRFSSALSVGALQSEQLSKAKISQQATSLDAALETLAVTLNKVAFEGFAGVIAGVTKPVYGILNDPSLSTYVASVSTDATADYNIVYAEQLSLLETLITQSGTHLDAYSKYRLCVTPKYHSRLMLVTNLGKTVWETLKQNFPNIELEIVPEFTGAYNATNDVVYIIGETEVGGVSNTADILFSELALASNIETHANYTSQVISSGTAGTVFYKPYNVVRMFVKTA